jgi:hypothetical protein
VGSLVAAVQMGALSGLVGAEQLQASATGTFDSLEAGNKPVNVRYSLLDGANGGLASNYEVENQVLWTSVLPKPSVNPGEKLGVNPVQPSWIPGSSAGGRRVMTVITSVPAALSAPRSDSASDCLVGVSENCQCQPSNLAGVDICFVPLDSVEKISATRKGF